MYLSKYLLYIFELLSMAPFWLSWKSDVYLWNKFGGTGFVSIQGLQKQIVIFYNILYTVSTQQ